MTATIKQTGNGYIVRLDGETVSVATQREAWAEADRMNAEARPPGAAQRCILVTIDPAGDWHVSYGRFGVRLHRHEAIDLIDAIAANPDEWDNQYRTGRGGKGEL